MTGIQFVTDEKGRKVGVLSDLKKHAVIWEDLSDGLISESRRKEKGIPYEQYRANRLKCTRPRGSGAGQNPRPAKLKGYTEKWRVRGRLSRRVHHR